MTESLFEYSALSDPSPEIMKQELITYLHRGDNIVRVTVKRDFTNGNYTDTMTTEVLYTW